MTSQPVASTGASVGSGMTHDHKAKASEVPSSEFVIARGTVAGRMQDLSHTDRRFNQTQERYAADDLETMQEARRYAEHVFGLVRPFIGRRVLEVGLGNRHHDHPSGRHRGLRPRYPADPNCVRRIQEAMAAIRGSHSAPATSRSATAAELASQRFDSVLCVNVLEHIADDAGALRAFKESSCPEGACWSLFRRFKRHTVRSMPSWVIIGATRSARCAAHSRQPVSSWFDFATPTPLAWPGWMYNAHISKSTAHRRRQVKLFERLVAPWALPLERLLPPPIGFRSWR